MLRGVIVGKFYPLHKGHSFLIETALSHVNELTVIVCERKGETIPGSLRVKWIREVHPRAKVILIENVYDDNDSDIWAQKTVEWLGYVPDVAFTSEEYGDRWSKLMGSRHVLVDIARKKFPVSGTQVRENPMDFWDLLEPSVRAYFARRICIVGSESTGTTTLSKELANHYKTTWVPEFGRIYAEARLYSQGSNNWRSNEFEFIAKIQNSFEDELAKTCNKILICDTDSFATSVWHERYMGYKSSAVEKFARTRSYDLYLLTDIDIPFIQDGTRDGENVRVWMHKRFITKLKNWSKKYIILSGDRKARFKKATEAINKVLL